jgi:hypothetical protein
MSKRNFISIILYHVSRILSVLPLLLLAFIVLVTSTALIMYVYYSFSGSQLFPKFLITDYTLWQVLWWIFIGILIIIGGFNFSRRKEWARKIFIGLCLLSLYYYFFNTIYSHFLGILSSEYMRRAALYIMFDILGLYLLNLPKVKKVFIRNIFEETFKMKKRNIWTTTLYVVGRILSNLPMIFIMFLMALGVIGLVMMFLLSGADWKIFGALINHDVVGIVYGLLWGVVSIVAWIGFSKKRDWARKVFIGICVVYLVIAFLNVVYLAVQGMLVAGHIQNSVLHIFYGFFGL